MIGYYAVIRRNPTLFFNVHVNESDEGIRVFYIFKQINFKNVYNKFVSLLKRLEYGTWTVGMCFSQKYSRLK